MENRKSLGEYIAQRRRALGMTQRQFAEKLYVTDSAVSKWERGVSHGLGYHTTNPRLHYFQNIKFWRYPQ